MQMDSTSSSVGTPVRTRRRSSAPDISKKLLWWTGPWGAGANDAPTNNPWNTTDHADSKQGGSPLAVDLPDGPISPTSARRRSSAPSPTAKLRKRTLSREDVLEDVAHVMENEDDDVIVEDLNFATTSHGSTHLRMRRTSSNPDLEVDKLINEDYFAGEDFRGPRRGSRRHSSRSSRSKSVELGASFSSTLEKVILSVLDDDDDGKRNTDGAKKGFRQQPAGPSGIRQKRFSTQFEGYNHLCEFDILEAEDFPAEILRDLESEGCPFCGVTSLETKSKFSPTASGAGFGARNVYAVMFCKRFGCRHVAHNLCINDTTVRKLTPLHNSNWMIVRVHPNKIPERDQIITKNSLQMQIRVSHIVSTICYAEFATAKPVNTCLREHSYGTTIECLHVPVDEFKTPVVFPVSRARIEVVLVDPKKGVETRFEGNFELTTNSDKWDLVASSAESQKFLSVSVERASNNLWSIKGVEVELGNPKVSVQPKLILSPISSIEIKEETKSSSSVQHTPVTPIVAPTPVQPSSSKPTPVVTLPKIQPAASIIVEEKKELKIDITSQTPPNASPAPSPKHRGDDVPPMEMYKQIQEFLVAASDGYIVPVPEPHAQHLIPLLSGQIANLAKTQMGSRFLQEQIKEKGAEFITLIYPEVFDSLDELMTDLFGNYLCQLLIRNCLPDQRLKLLRRLSNSMGDVACDRQGTRVMQKIIQYSSLPKERDVILEALSQHYLDMMYDPHGSYVINSLTELIPFDKLTGLLKVASDNCSSLAVNQHGLCVLKKCLSRCVAEKDESLTLVILDFVLDFVDNQYGNYLVQHVLAVGNADGRRQLHRKLQGSYCALSKQKFSSNVVEKCLGSLDSAEKEDIIKEFMDEREIGALLQDSYGNYVMQNALNLANGEQALNLIAMIRPHLKNLRKKIQKKWERLLKIAENRVHGLPVDMIDEFDEYESPSVSSSSQHSPKTRSAPSSSRFTPQSSAPTGGYKKGPSAVQATSRVGSSSNNNSSYAKRAAGGGASKSRK
eukprot:TRINITY_DN12175_c0_g1_i1.p1 TRINITY_DN12175_c0_g1~~TRINITY_DN12175_c0_g1_i1.p1  ORF type:complete len:1012 (+),score=259.86 TRINITY_DN12175_c0_g1_i1:37-3072(+)